MFLVNVVDYIILDLHLLKRTLYWTFIYPGTLYYLVDLINKTLIHQSNWISLSIHYSALNNAYKDY